MTDRCTGHCCRLFTLSFSPDELAAAAAAPGASEELKKIASMVVYAGKGKPAAFGVRVNDLHDVDGHRYNCRHLQADGNCGDYDNRPAMCSDYPYGRPCGYADCTLEPDTRPDVELSTLVDDAKAHARLLQGLDAVATKQSTRVD